MTDVTTDDTRYKKLLNEEHEIIKQIENYKQKEVPKDGHILHTPSSNGVCNYMHKCKQHSWIHWSDEQIKKYTDKEIIFRNKPRPGNKWWTKNIMKSPNVKKNFFKNHINKFRKELIKERLTLGVGSLKK